MRLVLSIALVFGLAGAGEPPRTHPFSYPAMAHFPPHLPDPTDNLTTIEGAELGRQLFYDPVLSNDRSISCATCHKQAQAFSGSPKPFDKGMRGVSQKRNTLPLFNLAWSPSFFWDGRASSLEEQALVPVRAHTEMDLSWTKAAERINTVPHYKKYFKDVFGIDLVDSTHIVKALAQFERTLISYNSKFDKAIRRETTFTREELEGFELVNDMTKGNCLHCHTTDANGLGTTFEFSNNGLDSVRDVSEFRDLGLGGITGKSEDYGKFKIPPLRNLSFTAPYMHDGRFKTLEDVLDFYSEGLHFSPTIDNKMEFLPKGGSRLSAAEKKKIIVFLKTLNDSVFITDPRFSSPFPASRRSRSAQQ